MSDIDAPDFFWDFRKAGQQVCQVLREFRPNPERLPMPEISLDDSLAVFARNQLLKSIEQRVEDISTSNIQKYKRYGSNGYRAFLEMSQIQGFDPIEITLQQEERAAENRKKHSESRKRRQAESGKAPSGKEYRPRAEFVKEDRRTELLRRELADGPFEITSEVVELYALYRAAIRDFTAATIQRLSISDPNHPDTIPAALRAGNRAYRQTLTS